MGHGGNRLGRAEFAAKPISLMTVCATPTSMPSMRVR
jgi:hypothetical protein